MILTVEEVINIEEKKLKNKIKIETETEVHQRIPKKKIKTLNKINFNNLVISFNLKYLY